ncbi:MAG TPA: large-conductance mechanosensitive channel protein MscL [Ignavibacteria bacterium]|nr:large-conductance mechanosensitive channel protein MscL [Ignavibacteria bacterium]HQY51336.1 large-conductance mechanosensitive channel protein MscL [Ignavibacteria bacterium]HRA99715.1 large-conductance mechanosensitive channel protein MscL [Ignavibacteria bacterium]
MLKEFKEFISKGNAIDLAIGVIIGGAFGAIVSSIVADLLMPFIGIIMGGIDFSGLSVAIGSAVFPYGKFIQATINFLIIAVVLFLIVKGINSMRKKEEDEAPAEPTKEEHLLMEIRDLLKSGKQ